MDDKKSSGKISIIGSAVIALLYCIANIIILQYHEHWRDEAQAWTIAKNLSVPEIFNLMSTEGHFIPWFIVLKVWKVLGGRFSYISIVSTVIMTVAVFIFMYKAPFNPIIKLLIVLSAPFFYYNAVISRCYCIVALAIVLAAMTRNNREHNPFAYSASLALLLQTHVLLFPFAIALFAEHSLECIISKNKKRIISIAVPALSLLMAFAELHQSKDQPTFNRVTFESLKENMTPDFMLSGLGSIIYKIYDHGSVFYCVAAALLILLVAFIAEGIITKSKKVINLLLVTLAGVFGFLAIVMLVRQCAHIQMALIFYMMVLFCIWAAVNDTGKKENKKSPYLVSTIIFTLICALSYVNLVKDIRYDITNRFSNSLAIAQDISVLLPEGSTVLVHPQPAISGPYSYVSEYRPDIIVWDVDDNEVYRCIVWGINQPETDIRELSNLPENTYYLTAVYSDNGFEEIISENEENTWSEYFYLFRIN